MTIRFKSALNHIEADEALVSKTEKYLRNTLAKEHKSRMADYRKWRMMDMKKLAIAACMAILLMGGAAVYATPLSYMSLDINPSVELGVNAVGHVITAEGYNEDGKAVLNGTKVKGKNVKEAVSALIDSAAHKGFIEDDGSTVVALTTETDNEDTDAKLKEEAKDGADEALTENGKSADVLENNVALARRDDARALGITPGKLNLIEKLEAADPEAYQAISEDDYKTIPVKDIMAAIKQARIDQRDEATANNNDDVTVDNKDDVTVDSTDEAFVNNNGQGATPNKGQGAINNNGNGAANRNNIDK